MHGYMDVKLYWHIHKFWHHGRLRSHIKMIVKNLWYSIKILLDIGDFHCGVYLDCGLSYHETVWSGTWVPIFRMDMLPPSSGQKMDAACVGRQSDMKLIDAFVRESDWSINKAISSSQHALSELVPIFSFLSAHSLSTQRTWILSLLNGTAHVTSSTAKWWGSWFGWNNVVQSRAKVVQRALATIGYVLQSSSLLKNVHCWRRSSIPWNKANALN
jgi:hypothetical protein